jgi:carboxypeptidase C (cathepsin A)
VLSPEPASLPAFLAKVEQFATHEYSSALLAGDRLDAAEKTRVAAQLAAYTGLSAAYWRKANLRVNSVEFEKALLASRGMVIGRLDGRYVNYAMHPVLATREYSVMSSAITDAFTAAINRYLGHDLHYATRRSYLVMNSKVHQEWDWSHRMPFRDFGARPGFTNVVPDLRRAMITNPHLQLMVNEGYFDLGTPFFSTEYTIGELELPRALRAHVHIHHYTVGHMLYLNVPALEALHRNLDRFIHMATATSAP